MISSENVWDKLTGFAGQSGLNVDAFKACLSSPDAQKAVDANRADGVALGINSTPTAYVNGRPIIGGNPATITQDIDFELAQKKPAAATSQTAIRLPQRSARAVTALACAWIWLISSESFSGAMAFPSE